ncbi:hypothetical protein D1872_155380 [compost metagenome]
MNQDEVFELRVKKMRYNIKTIEIAKALGISVGAVSRWERGIIMLSQEKQKMYRDYILKREEAYLRGEENDKKKKEA